MTPEDFPAPDVTLWPENWAPFQLFTRNSTQWRVGMGGPIGLDYGIIFHELDREGLDREKYDDIMEMIRVIESTALKEIYKK